MTAPTIYDVASITLAGGAFALSFLRFKDGRRRPPPVVEVSTTSMEGAPEWDRITLVFENISDHPIYAVDLKVPFWSRSRLLVVDASGEPTNPFGETEWRGETLLENVAEAKKCVPIRRLIKPGAYMSKSLFIFRKRTMILPIVMWSDSKSTFTLQIQIP